MTTPSLPEQTQARLTGGSERRRLPLFGGIGLLAVLALAGALYWNSERHYLSTDDAFVDAQIVRIAPQVSGVVQELTALPNRHVQAGERLVIINPDSTEAQLKQQQAGLVQSDAQASQVAAGVAAAQAQLEQSRAIAAGAAAQSAKAADVLKRLLALQQRDPGTVTAADLESARTTAQAAAAQLAAANANVAAASAQLSNANQAVAAAGAQKDSAQARLDQARLTLGQNFVVAPLAGYVTSISVNKGSYVAPGTQMMALVPDTLWVTANFKETQLRYIRPGQPVDITVDAYPGVTFKGKVDSIQRGAGQAFQLFPPQNATANFVKVVQRVPVRILFDGLDQTRYPIGPGMSVVPRIRIG